MRVGDALDPCVHCGFCLQSCPTYVATNDEADSPRGRIVLMQKLAAGDLLPTDERAVFHLNRCLGCRACESACPSGVEYGRALEECRAELIDTHPLPLRARLVLAVMAERRIRRPLLALSRWLRPLAGLLAGPSRIGFQMGMLAASRMKLPASADRTDDEVEGAGTPDGPPAPPPAERQTSAVVFTGCIMEGLFSHVNAATARTLVANGFTLVRVPEQGCCGALHAHAGLREQALTLARHNVQAFAVQPRSTVVVNSAGCGAILKEYGRLLAGDPIQRDAERFAARVRDVSEVLAGAGPRPGAPLNLTVAVDPACHLEHAQRVVNPPRAVLAAIPGLTCRVPADASHCCGSAGVYSVLEPELSGQVMSRKLDTLHAVAPDVIATANPGCIMQLGAGVLASDGNKPVVHPVELLDASYRRAGYYAA